MVLLPGKIVVTLAGTMPLSSLLATWFGLGRSPFAPGTLGSIGAVPLHVALCTQSPLLHAMVVVAASVGGLLVAELEARRSGLVDPQQVVIDEVAGTLIAMGLVRDLGWPAQIAALVAFRVLDITKPWPISRFEHATPAGLGIMLDDLAAGVLAGLVLRLSWLALI